VALANDPNDDWTVILNKPVTPTKPSGPLPIAASPDDGWDIGIKITDPTTRSGPDRWVADPLARGWESGMQAVDTIRMLTGNLSAEDFARNIAEHDFNKLAHPVHPDDQAGFDAINNAEGWGQVLEVLKRPNIWFQVAGESLPQMAVSTGAGLAGGLATGGPIGGVLGTFAGSTATEFANSVLDAVRASKPGKVLDQYDIAEAVRDPALMATAREYAIKRGVSVGAFDALTFGLAGKFFGPVERVISKAGAPDVLGRAAGAATEGIVGGAGGAGGEAAGQLWSTGEIKQPGMVAMEGVAEVPGAGLDIAAKSLIPETPTAEKFIPPTREPVRPDMPPNMVDQANVQQVNPDDWSMGPILAPAQGLDPLAPQAPVPAQATQSPVSAQPVPVQVPVPTETKISPSNNPAETPADVQPVSTDTPDTSPAAVTVAPVNPPAQTQPSVAQTQPSVAQVSPAPQVTPAPTVEPSSTPEPAAPEDGPRPAITPKGSLARLGRALRAVEANLTGTKKQRDNAADTIAGLKTNPKVREDDTPEGYRIGDEVVPRQYASAERVVSVENQKDGVTYLTTLDRQGALHRHNAAQISNHIPMQTGTVPPKRPWWHGSAEPNPQGVQPGDKIVTATGERGTVAGVWKSQSTILTRKNGFTSKPVNVAYVPEGQTEGTYKTTGVENVKKATSAPAAPANTKAPAEVSPAPKRSFGKKEGDAFEGYHFVATLPDGRKVKFWRNTGVGGSSLHGAYIATPLDANGKELIGDTDTLTYSLDELKQKFDAGELDARLAEAHDKAAKPKKLADASPSEKDETTEPVEATPDTEPEALPDDRRPKGTLAPQTEDVSMTRRRSIFEEAYRAAGYDPDVAINLPPLKRVEILRKLLVDTFGFRAVQVTGAVKDATNQMLDAYRNVRFMMHVLGLPVEGVSLDGSLTLTLEPEGRPYFGVYWPGQKMIGLPGRSNSFAHEWAHALDDFLADRLKQAPELLTRLTRAVGINPNDSLEAAFINLINKMFFEDSAVAVRALQLAKDAAAVDKNGKPTISALLAQKQLASLEAGSTRLHMPKSAYRQRSEDYAPGSAGYFGDVAEMLARAFEAYVAHKMELAGGSNEFITKGEQAYLSDADRRLDMTFPKGLDREIVFAAIDDVMHHIRNRAILGTGPTAPKPADTDIVDPQYWNRIVLMQGNPTISDAIKKEAMAVRNAMQNAASNLPQALKEGVSQLAMNAGINTNASPRVVGKTFVDFVRFYLFSMRGAVRPRIARNKGKGSLLMQAVFDKFANIAGSGRVQQETYEDERQQQSQKDIFRIENALRGNGFDKIRLSEAENEIVRETMFGNAPANAPARLTKLAAALRRIYEDAHSRLEKIVKVGYVTSKGYLPRALNTSKVQTDPNAFAADAAKLYKIVYRNILKAMSEPRDLIEIANAVDNAMGNTTGKSRFDTEVTALRAALRAENKATQALLTAVNNKAPAQEIDKARIAVQKAKADTKSAFAALARVVEDPYAETAAAAWALKIVAGDSFAYDSHGPAANFTKNRTLPDEADEILKDWYNQDVVNLTANYVHSAHSRAAYVERAGNPSGTHRLQDVLARKDVQNRMNAGTAAQAKYGVGRDIKDMTEAQRLAVINDLANPAEDNILELLLTEAARSGASHDDVTFLRGAVATIAGRGDHSPNASYMNRFSGWIFAYSYLKLLPRAAITSLTEPVSMLLRTGNAKSMFNTFANYLSELNQSSKSVQERQAIARALGIVSSPLYDTLLMARMGLDQGHITSGNVLLANFFRANFLSAVTNAQRRSVMAGGFTWMRDMAMTHGQTDAIHKKIIEAEFKELGVREEDLTSFMDWLAQSPDLPDLAALDTKAGKVFESAIHRFIGQVIQDPRRADKPMLASTPFGRLVYALTSYLYAFFSNVHAATVTRAQRNYAIAKGEGATTGAAVIEAALPALASFAGGFAILFAGQMLVATLRESLLNGEQWEKHRKEGDLLSWLTNLSVSRTGIAGPADVVLNSLYGLKYERDLSNLLVGPGFSTIFSDMQNIASLATSNSKNTNTAERNAAKGFYRLIVAPLLSGVLTSMDTVGPVGSAARYFGMIGLTSNAAASKFADMLAGAPTTKEELSAARKADREAKKAAESAAQFE